MVFKQRFFRYVAHGLGHGWRWRGHGHGPTLKYRGDLVHVAGYQLQFGLAVGGAAGVGECDPAGNVELVFGGIEFHHVVGLPGQSAGQVAQLHGLLRCATIVQRHHQRGAVAQVGWHVAVDDASGYAGLDALADFEYHTVVGRQHFCLLGGLDPGGRVGADDAHAASHVFFQQFLWRQQVKVKVLLLHRQATRRAGAAQQRGFGAHAGADVAKGQCRYARLELQFALVLDQGQVLVVDGDGHLLLVSERAALFVGLPMGGTGKGEHQEGRHDRALHEGNSPKKDGDDTRC